MTISSTDIRILSQKSGNRCAFPDCGKILTLDDTQNEISTLTSNIAHIVARSYDGPRGHYSLPIDQRDNEDNLILLCQEHHKLIDDFPEKYSVERLRRIKCDHEENIKKVTSNSIYKKQPQMVNKEEIVFSNIFEVIKLPNYIYAFKKKTNLSIPPIIKDSNNSQDLIFSYIEKMGQIFSFMDPREFIISQNGQIDINEIRQIPTRQWWENSNSERWFIELLNKSVDIFMTSKGLAKDDYHSRYYFTPDSIGNPKSILYRPLNQSAAQKNVVWSPITKKTGVNKKYWLHRAISLRFFHINANNWCLSLRPEFRVTKDGFILLESEKIGAKITNKKSRMFNYDLLGEVNFWRSFLSNNEPRIILNFGNSSTIISTNLISATVFWPGIPDKFAKSFTNIEYADDLFTWQKLQDISENDDFEIDFEDEDES